MKDDPQPYIPLILSHGRPKNIKTIHTLRKSGYTGRYVIVIDDEDDTADQYREIHGEENVVQFCKADIAARIDNGDITGDRRCILYARNAAFDIAEQLGFRYFIQLDDDYTIFRYRFDRERHYNASGHHPIKNLDDTFRAFVDYLHETPQLQTLAMAQGGDFIGGALSSFSAHIQTKRKAMNSFFCDTERRFEFTGRLNEDVNAYTAHQRRGNVYLTVNAASLEQIATQAGNGGMSGTYVDGGTYVKSFYSIMHCPSAVTMRLMGYRSYRVHHLVDYNACAPKILRPAQKVQ